MDDAVRTIGLSKRFPILAATLCVGAFSLAGMPAARGQSTDTMVTLAGVPTEAISPKKGYGLSPKKNPQWAEQLRTLRVSWFYTWGPSALPGASEGVEFVPMIWGAGVKTPDSLAMLREEARQKRFRHLLGFNEPDSAKQSNILVSRAIELWPQLEAVGLPLGSPAAVKADGPWMLEFMGEAGKRGYRVDFITVHSYGGTNAEAFLERLATIHKTFSLPLWITELGVADWKATAERPNHHTPQKVAEFMRRVVPAMERLDYVHRYAWFCATPDSLPLGPCALFDKDGALTELGRLYASF